MSGARLVNVSTEAQLQSAMGGLRNGDTIILANGTYALSSSLIINGRHNVTIRGASGSTNVVLLGKGMDNANHGGVPHGVWSNGTNTTIAHLTIRDTYDNPIIFNSGAQAPLVYAVTLLDAGSQFIKSNPTDVNAGRGVNDGRVEYCWFEYTGKTPADHGAGAGYFNGISAHAAKNWVVRKNTFKNLHNPDGSSYPWNPSVLFWRNSSNTVTEQNTFINVDRAVAYGLDNSTPYRDHAGGAIRNNFVYLAPGFLSPARKASSDGSIIVWNSPGTQVDHNTVIGNQNTFWSIEFRFRSSSNAFGRNNLADAPLHLRDSAAATLSGNVTNAQPAWFIDPSAADLHLKPGAAGVIDKAAPLNTVTNDFDGDLRPAGAAPDAGADEFTLREPPRILRLALEGADARLEFQAAPASSLAVETAERLDGNWRETASGLAGTSGLADYTEAGGAEFDARFYRLRLEE